MKMKFFFCSHYKQNFVSLRFYHSNKGFKRINVFTLSNPLATQRAFHILILQSILLLHLEAYFAVKKCWSVRLSLSYQVALAISKSYSVCNFFFHLPALFLCIAFLRLGRSGVKHFLLLATQKNPWGTWVNAYWKKAWLGLEWQELFESEEWD